MEINLEVIQQYAIEYGVKIVIALVILLVGKWLAKAVSNFCEKSMTKYKVDVTLTSFLGNIIYYALLVAVVLAAVGQLGINTTSFLTVLGAASLAVGLALKDSLANFSSGVLLILFRPFNVGDLVNIAGETGKVEKITIFNTIINTADNQRKIIPNGAIANETVTNINANPTRRIELIIGIGYDDDIKHAKETLETIMTSDSRVLEDPAPLVAVSNLGASSVDLIIRPWVKTSDYWDVYFDLIETVKLTFDEKQISFPYPQQDVHLYKTDGE